MKLYGKELDDELAKRRQDQDIRRAQKLTIRKAAEQRGISPSNLIAYERGDDICPHEEWTDQVGGFPTPLFISKVCTKCGKLLEDSMERVGDKNRDRVAAVFKMSMEKLSEGIRDGK